jgi:hypothetical protein
VRHEAVDSVSRRRSHQERSVSSRPRVVAFEEAALEWPTTDRTLGRDAPSLAPWRRWRGPTNVPLRANDRVRRQPTERTPIDAAMGSARSDLDAPGSRQPAVALDDGQDHMVHLYFPRVPVMVCTTTGTLVPRTSPAPCARQIHALPDGWVPVAVDRPRVPPRIARPTTCWSMCRPMLLNSTRRSTSEHVGSGMPPPLYAQLWANSVMRPPRSCQPGPATPVRAPYAQQERFSDDYHTIQDSLRPTVTKRPAQEQARRCIPC